MRSGPSSESTRPRRDCTRPRIMPRKALGDRERDRPATRRGRALPDRGRHDRRDRVRSRSPPTRCTTTTAGHARLSHSTATAVRSSRPTRTSRGPTCPPRARSPAPRVTAAPRQRWDVLLAEEPADEEAHVALMRAYVARGDRHAALRQYERMDRALRDELGLVPSEQATRLRDEILAVLRHATVPEESSDEGLRRRASTELEVLTDLLGAVGSGPRATPCSSPGHRESASLLLVEQLRSRATALGWRCGIGGAAAIEGAWPYAAVLEAYGRPRPPAPDAARWSRRLVPLGDRPGSAGRRGAGLKRQPPSRPAVPQSGGRRVGHQRLFVAASELMRLAASGPGLLLVIDDGHDADDASLRLLHYLARSAAEARVADRDRPAFERRRTSTRRNPREPPAARRADRDRRSSAWISTRRGPFVDAVSSGHHRGGCQSYRDHLGWQPLRDHRALAT